MDEKIVDFTFDGEELTIKTMKSEIVYSLARHFSGHLDHQAELLHHLSLILQSMAGRKMGEEQRTKEAIKQGLH